MSRLSVMFHATRKAARAALIGYVPASHPDPRASVDLLLALEHAGLDALELGFPVQHPFLDGPLIRRAHRQALDAGASLRGTLDLVAMFRDRGGKSPIVLMGYAAAVLGFGARRFARRAAVAGVDGVIIADLGVREAAQDLLPALAGNGLCMIPIYSPEVGTSDLVHEVPGVGGFAYCIPSLARTGGRMASAAAIRGAIDICRKATRLPVCVGFGIKTPASAHGVAQYADGVAIGTALIARIETDRAFRQANDPARCFARSSRFVARLRHAVVRDPATPRIERGVPSVVTRAVQAARATTKGGGR